MLGVEVVEVDEGQSLGAVTLRVTVDPVRRPVLFRGTRYF